MLQHVNQVFVGKTFGALATQDAVDAAAVGTVFIADKNFNVAGTDKSSVFHIGIVEGKTTVTTPAGVTETKSVVRWSNDIQVAKINNIKNNTHVASAEDVVNVNFADINVEVGHRYVIRIIYKDIDVHPGQFTHTYEVVAKTTAIADLVDTFLKKVNKHPGARVVASANTNILTLTAKPKGDSEGLDPIDLYSQVSMDVVAYRTIPTGILSNVAYPIAGLTISKTQGTPGKGNPKVVRDRYNEALGYQGISHRANGIWPYVAPVAPVDLDGQYEEFVMEWNNDYRSNDNQYIKNTPFTLEVYFDSTGETAKLVSAIDAIVNPA